MKFRIMNKFTLHIASAALFFVCFACVGCGDSSGVQVSSTEELAAQQAQEKATQEAYEKSMAESYGKK